MLALVLAASVIAQSIGASSYAPSAASPTGSPAPAAATGARVLGMERDPNGTQVMLHFAPFTAAVAAELAAQPYGLTLVESFPSLGRYVFDLPQVRVTQADATTAFVDFPAVATQKEIDDYLATNQLKVIGWIPDPDRPGSLALVSLPTISPQLIDGANGLWRAMLPPRADRARLDDWARASNFKVASYNPDSGELILQGPPIPQPVVVAPTIPARVTSIHYTPPTATVVTPPVTTPPATSGANLFVRFALSTTQSEVSGIIALTGGTLLGYDATTGLAAITAPAAKLAALTQLYSGLPGVSCVNVSATACAPAVTAVVPSAPTGLTAQATSAAVTLAWAAVTGATAYGVFRSASSAGTYIELGRATTPSFQDAAPLAGTGYYQVLSLRPCAATVTDRGGCDDAQPAFDSRFGTAPVPATLAAPPAPPAPPTGLSGSGAGGTVTLTWTAATGAVAYLVFRAAAPTGPYASVGRVTGTAFQDSQAPTGTSYYRVMSLQTCVVGTADLGGCDGAPAVLDQRFAGDAVAVPVIPPAVAGPTLVANALNGHVALSWPAVAGATSYHVYRAQPGMAPVLLAGTTGTSLVDTGGSPGLAYTYNVLPDLPAGVSGAAFSATVVWQAATSQPTVSRVGPADGTLSGTVQLQLEGRTGTGTGQVSWSLSGPAGIASLGSAGSIPSVGDPLAWTATLTWDSSRVADGSYTLTGVVNDGSGNSTTVTQAYRVDNGRPTAPLGFAAAAVTGGIALSWEQATTAAGALYRVYRDGAVQPLAELSSDSRSYLDTGAGAHSYRLVLVGRNGQSSDSVTSQATAKAGAPAPVVGFRVTLPSGAPLAIDGRVTGRLLLQSHVVPSSAVTFEYSSDGITWLAVTAPVSCSDGCSADWNAGGLAAGHWLVRARSGALFSPASGFVVAAPVGLAAPTAPVAQVVGGGLRLHWTPSSETLPLAYTIWKRSGADWQMLDRTAATDYLDTSAVSDSRSEYRVNAIDGDGVDGMVSSSVLAKFPTVTAPSVTTAAANAPSGLGARAAVGGVALVWTASDHATGYQVERSWSPDGPFVLAGTALGTVFVDRAAAVGGQAYYRVRASGGGLSAASTVVGALLLPVPAAVDSNADFVVGSGLAPAATAQPGDLVLSPAAANQVLAGGRLNVVASGTSVQPVSQARFELAPASSSTAAWSALATIAATSDGSAWTALGTVRTAGVAPGSYQIRVVALAANGSTVETTAAGLIQVVHSAPAPLQVQASVQADAIKVSWKAPSSGLPLTYSVYRIDPSSADFMLVRSGVAATSLADGFLPGAADVGYVVTATDAAGNESPLSNPAWLTTPAAWTSAAPQLHLLAPALADMTSLLPGETLLGAEVSSATGISSVSFAYAPQGSGDWLQIPDPLPLGGGIGGPSLAGLPQLTAWAANWNTSGLLGTYDLRLTATDSHGRTSQQQSSVTFCGSCGRGPPSGGLTATTADSVSSADGMVTLTITTATGLSTHLSVTANPATDNMPAGIRQVGAAYQVEAASLASGTALHRLDRPAAISFNLPVGMDPAAAAGLAIYHWDPAGQVWRLEPSVVDTVNHRITATVSHFSIFAVAGPCSTSVAGAPTLCPTSDELQVDLTWTFSGTAATYNLLRSTTSGTYGAPLVTGLTGLSYKDFAVTAGTTFFYEVVPVDSLGTGGTASGEVSGTPLAEASSPAVTDLQLNGVTIPPAGTHFMKTIQLTAVATDNVRVTQFRFEYQVPLGEGWITIATVPVATPAGASSYTASASLNTLNPWLSGSYTVRATAYNLGGRLTSRTATVISDNGPRLVSSVSFAPLLAAGNLSTTDPVVATLSAAGGVGALTISYALDPGAVPTYSTYSGPISITGNGLHRLKFFATDSTGAPEPKINDGPLTIDTTRPTLTVTPGQAQNDLSWTANPSAVSYDIYKSTVSGAYDGPTTNGAATTWVDFVVTPGTTYFYKVIPIDGIGSQHLASIEAMGTPAAETSAPAIADVLLNGTSIPGGGAHFSGIIHLSATATDAVNVTSLLFEYRPAGSSAAFTTIGTVAPSEPAGSGTFTGTVAFNTVSPLLLGTYTLRVTAANVGTSTAQSTATLVSDNVGPPSLTVTPGEAQNSLSWTYAGTAASYNLYRSLSSGTYGSPYQTGLTDTTFHDFQVTVGTNYFYEVAPVNASAIQGAISAEASGTPLAETSLPAITALQLNGATIPGGGAHFSHSIQLTAVATDPVKVTSFLFEYQPLATPAAPWTLIGTAALATGPGAASYTGGVSLNTLSPWLDSSYTLRVTATNFGGNTSQSTATLISDNGPALVSSAAFSPTLGAGSVSTADPTTVTLTAIGGVGTTTFSYAVDPAAFIEIAGAGGAISQPVGDDNVNAGIPIGFNFPFFGTSYSSINMSNDYWLSPVVSTSRYSWGGVTLPTSGIDHYIFPLTFDGDVDTGTTPPGSVWTKSTPTQFVAEWKNGEHCCIVGGPFTFEVILSSTGEIDFVYQHLDATATSYQPLIGLNQGDGVHGLEAPSSRHAQPVDGTIYRWLPNTSGSYDLTAGSTGTATTFTTYAGPIAISGQGTHDIQFYATDSTGAQETPKHDVHFTIDSRGLVTGRVVDNGNPAAGIAGVRVGTKGGTTWLVTTTTAADGTYSLPLLPGTYTIYSDQHDTRYAVPSPVSGVVVLNGATTSSVNFTSNRWAFISGTLVDSSAGTLPVGGALVTAYSHPSYCQNYQINGLGTSDCNPTRYQATTAADGTFLIEVDPPSSAPVYSIQPIVVQGLTNLPYLSHGISDIAAAAISTVGSTTALPTNLVVARNGTITGAIQDDLGARLGGVGVQIQRYAYYGWQGNVGYSGTLLTTSASSSLDTVTPGALGTYSISAPVSTYVVVLPQPLANYTTPANSTGLNVNAGSATPNNPLVYYRDATVSGTVFSDTGGLPSVTIFFQGYDAGGRNYYTGSTALTAMPVPSPAPALGHYPIGTFSFLVPAGAGSQVSISPTSATAFVDGYGYADPPSYTDYALAAAGSFIRDFSFHPFGTITGHVLKEDGTAPGVAMHLHVDVTDAHGQFHRFCYGGDTSGDPSYCYSNPTTGVYSINVTAGTATVYFDTNVPGLGFAEPIANALGYGGQSALVTTASTTAGIDFQIYGPVTLSGSVGGNNGATAVALPVAATVYGYVYDAFGRSVGLQQATTPAGGGAFSLSVSPGGRADVGGYPISGWQSPTQQSVTLVKDVNPASLTLTYVEYGTITIVLEDDSTPPIPVQCTYYSCTIYLTYPGHPYSYYLYSNPSGGSLTRSDILPNVFTITPPVITGLSTPAAQTLTVIGGATSLFTFVYIRPRGSVTGTVTDNGIVHSPLAGIRVGTQNADTTWATTTTTAADGTYTLNLPVGTQTIYADADSDNRYQTPAPITGVGVTNGGTTTGVNFVYNRWSFITGRLVDTATPATNVVGVNVTALICCSVDFQATTAADGTFRIQVDTSFSLYTVQPVPTAGFTKLNYAQGGAVDQLVNGVNVTVALAANLVVARNGSVTGLVEDDLLHPLAGATVQVVDYEYSFYNGCGCYNQVLLTYSATSLTDGSYQVVAPVAVGVTLQPQLLSGYTTPFNGSSTVAAGTPTANPRPFIYTRDATLTGGVYSDTGGLPSVTVQFQGYDRASHGYTSSAVIAAVPVPSPAPAPPGPYLIGTFSFLVPAGAGSSVQLGFLYGANFADGYGFAIPSSYSDDALAPGGSRIHNFTFHPYGTVTGHVLKPGAAGPGQPIHMHVDVIDANGQSHTFCTGYDVTTDPTYCYADPTTGAYSINVMAGTANVYSDTAVPNFGQAGPVATTATPYAHIAVASAMTTGGADFQFQRWVHLTGTSAGDAGALPGIYNVVVSQRDSWGRGEGSQQQTEPAIGGGFDFTVPPGTSYLNVDRSFTHWQTPDQLAVTVALDTGASGVVFNYRRLGTVQLILQDDSTPTNALSYCCYISVSSTTVSRFYYVLAGGTVDVLPDSYVITPPAINPYLAPGAQTIAVVAAATTTFTFTYRHFATVSGHVTSHFAPATFLAGVQVCDDLNNCATTDSGGFYTINVGSGPRHLIPQRFVVGYLVMDPIDLGTLSSAATITRDLAYIQNGTISGHALDQAGHPLVNAGGSQVGATIYYDYYDPSTTGFLHEYSVVSNPATGAFTISVPPAADVAIHARPLTGYEPAADVHAAVVEGTDTPNSNLTFTRDALVTVTVADDISGAVSPQPAIYFSGAHGSFAGSAAPGATSFQIFVRPDAYVVTPGGAQFYVTPAATSSVTYNASDTPTLTFTYLRFATISGTVIGDDAPAGVTGMPVQASEGGSQVDYRTTAGGGVYTLHAPPTTTVHIIVTALGGQGYDAPLTGATVDEGVLAAGAAITGVNFTYLKWGTVEGTVTDELLTGIGGVSIVTSAGGTAVSAGGLLAGTAAGAGDPRSA